MGLTDCRRWLGWGIANVHVGPEQFQACQLQAGRLRTGCQALGGVGQKREEEAHGVDNGETRGEGEGRCDGR